MIHGGCCLLFTFVDQKFASHSKMKEITFFIYDNPFDEFINACKYVQEYYNIIQQCNIKYNDDSFMFTSIRDNQFLFKTQGKTEYYCTMIQKVATHIGLDGLLYRNHSLRYGENKHKLIFSLYHYNLEQIRYIAGQAFKNQKDTISNYDYVGKYIFKTLEERKFDDHARLMKKQSLQAVQIKDLFKTSCTGDQ